MKIELSYDYHLTGLVNDKSVDIFDENDVLIKQYEYDSSIDDYVLTNVTDGMDMSTYLEEAFFAYSSLTGYGFSNDYTYADGMYSLSIEDYYVELYRITLKGIQATYKFENDKLVSAEGVIQTGLYNIIWTFTVGEGTVVEPTVE